MDASNNKPASDDAVVEDYVVTFEVVTPEGDVTTPDADEQQQFQEQQEVSPAQSTTTGKSSTKHRHSISHICVSVRDETGHSQALTIDDPSGTSDESTNKPGLVTDDLSARLKLRRSSEMAVDVMRFSAQYRRKELEQLLEEYRGLVKAIQQEDSNQIDDQKQSSG